jgi:hypothetical protein
VIGQVRSHVFICHTASPLLGNSAAIHADSS